MIDDLLTLSGRFLSLKWQPFKRYLFEELETSKQGSLIVGQRGVGKTTLIVQHILRFADDDLATREALYVPCDHFLVRRYTLYEIAEAFSLLGGKLICFDEVHKYQEWSEELKSIIDTYPKLQVLASGSSALELTKGSHDLSRRMLRKELVGLSFREFIALKTSISFDVISLKVLLKKHVAIAQQIVSEIEDSGEKIIALFYQYLTHGFFPYFKECSSQKDFYLTLQQNVDRTLDSDLAAVYSNLTGKSIGKIRKLLTFLSQSSPFTPNITKLAELIEVGDDRTIYDYLKYLEQTKLVKLLPRSGSLASELGKTEKIYLDNPNLINALSVEPETNTGTIRETFFFNALSAKYEVRAPLKGDFIIDGKYTFEIGGKSKTFKQLKNIPSSFLAIDPIEAGAGNKIPLWLFGFLY